MKFRKTCSFLAAAALSAACLAGCAGQEAATTTAPLPSTSIAATSGLSGSYASVGTFSTEDVFGTTYTQDLFKNYDLTLVNAFTTWCPPCVKEMPELEKLRQAYTDKGIKLGVVAVVLDVKTPIGIDKSALEQAKLLSERSAAQFPFLIPDDSEMNGRLSGIDSVPESFFVDSDGNIVSAAYIGARTQEEWARIVDAELAKLKGE